MAKNTQHTPHAKGRKDTGKKQSKKVSGNANSKQPSIELPKPNSKTLLEKINAILTRPYQKLNVSIENVQVTVTKGKKPTTVFCFEKVRKVKVHQKTNIGHKTGKLPENVILHEAFEGPSVSGSYTFKNIEIISDGAGNATIVKQKETVWELNKAA